MQNASSLEEMSLETGLLWLPKEELPLGWEALAEPPEGPGQLMCCWGKKVYPEKMYPEETHHVCEHPACLKAATNFVF